MATEVQNQDLMQENHLRKQLAVAIRSIQWSYAIFWSISNKQQGTLEWGNGYYNGDIKTRKTMQPMAFNVDKLGLKRSEQLKELYECLAIGESNEQTKRPSASLSPEDLSDAEWFYLVCMSFTFAPGVGLPGRAFANGQHIWLCNAQYADSKIFTRSLLAKSASIQTVVCFPMLGGVIELGVTDLIAEDLNLLQHIKTVFLEIPKQICHEKSISSPRNDDNGEEPVCEIDQDIVDTMGGFEKFNPVVECDLQTKGEEDQIFPFLIPPYREKFEFDQNNVHQELKADAPSDSSDESETNQLTEDSFMMEGTNGGGASQVQSWQFMDDDFSNCVPISMNSSDCISQTYNNDVHYTRTLSVILGNSSHLSAAPCSQNGSKKSSFVLWKKGHMAITRKSTNGTPQKTLKKILFDIPMMHSEKNKFKEDEGGDFDVSHFLLENDEKLNDPFLVLRSLVPSMNKLDNESVLGDTIEYLKDLERRVEELESRGRKKCDSDIGDNTEKPSVNKRKASDIDEIDPELDWVSPRHSLGAAEVSVGIEEKEVTIEMHVPWRDCLLLEIMDALSNLQLDAHSVSSSTSDGILSLTLKCKFRGAGFMTAGKIEFAIQRVVCSVQQRDPSAAGSILA